MGRDMLNAVYSNVYLFYSVFNTYSLCTYYMPRRVWALEKVQENSNLGSGSLSRKTGNVAQNISARASDG